MKNLINRFVLFVPRVDRQKIQMAFALIALVLLVLGAGAPDNGGIGNH